MAEIENEIRDGWTPITELGPSAIGKRTKKKTNIDPVDAVLSFGLSAVFDVLCPIKDIYYYLTVFRVFLKRG